MGDARTLHALHITGLRYITATRATRMMMKPTTEYPNALTSWDNTAHHKDRTALSYSSLGHYGLAETEDGADFCANPGQFIANWLGKREQKSTTALEFGTLLHLAVYEPHRLDEYAERPIKPGGALHPTNSAIFKAWAKEHAGKVYCTPKDMRLVDALLDACNHSPALASLRAAGSLYKEQSMRWMDPDTGICCKLRADEVFAGTNDDGEACWILADLKSTPNAMPVAFARSCRKFGYWRRLEFYQRGGLAITGVLPQVVLIAVSKEASPYQVLVCEPQAEHMQQAKRENDAALRDIRRRFDQDDWLAEWQREIVII